jgi:hypothetical protein
MIFCVAPNIWYLELRFLYVGKAQHCLHSVFFKKNKNVILNFEKIWGFVELGLHLVSDY